MGIKSGRRFTAGRRRRKKRLEVEGGADGWGPLSVRGGEGARYRFGRGLVGPRAASPYWAEGFPEAQFIFFFLFFSSSFLLFCFSISFTDFAQLLQINSNHFQKFCKIQGKVLNQ
jgi:hypothetical protein